ncbi:hypothetical protein [Mesorhizobium sp. WSM2239]|uniref:Uncharacterized protein n=2 Tax=unclassified Mesorhizobium TaxID=325217 RepID=A0AAU8D6G3_9HYPH
MNAEDAEPASLTVVQSVVVMLLAVAMAAGLWATIGVHFPNIWYQMFAALFITSILAPIFSVFLLHDFIPAAPCQQRHQATGLSRIT